MKKKDISKVAFFRSEDMLMRHLRCPQCGEYLAPVDIESFSSCPYCAAVIERTPEVDDFTIEPLVAQWENHYPRLEKR